tara:strand:- start:710 stop:889 length:180 start_codon:yes stop_codon:yes gene_type:complete
MIKQNEQKSHNLLAVLWDRPKTNKINKKAGSLRPFYGWRENEKYNLEIAKKKDLKISRF